MAWQSYIDQQICANVSCRLAVIAGLSDGAIWAKYENDLPDSVRPEEVKAIADSMSSNPDYLRENGIYLANEKYFCAEAGSNSVRGHKGKSALAAESTNTCLIVVATTDGFSREKLNEIVEKLANYLRASDY